MLLAYLSIYNDRKEESISTIEALPDMPAQEALALLKTSANNYILGDHDWKDAYCEVSISISSVPSTIEKMTTLVSLDGRTGYTLEDVHYIVDNGEIKE